MYEAVMVTKKPNLTELLEQQVVIGDGAMGTMLYEQGVFLNSCFDELNLSRADMVRNVHEGYIKAGADFIETNTFGANEFRLGQFGLADKVEAINQAGVTIARQAIENEASTNTAEQTHEILIAGSVGPLGVPLAPLGKLTVSQCSKAYKRQLKALADAGVDFIVFETFSNPEELLVALDAAARICSLPIIAQLTTNEFKETTYGQPLKEAISKIATHDMATAVGLNCSTGPAAMLSSLDIIRNVTDKPISLQPNAGMPRQVEGRNIYMSTPEYMAEYAKRFFEKGVQIIGGCCGTTPEHIKQIAQAVRSLDKAMGHKKAANNKTDYANNIRISTATPAVKNGAVGSANTTTTEPATTALPLEKKSKLGQKIAQGEKVIAIEITPPRGSSLATIIEKARLCASHNIDAINIPDGPRASSRISPLITAIEIQRACKIEALLHICCRDRNIIGLQSDIMGAYAAGVKNVLIITGDPPKLGEYPDATAVFDLDSIGLTSIINNLNRGIDVGGNSFDPPLALTVSVGANPVAVDLEREIERFKLKVQAGAEYAITQPVFDTQMLFDFIDAANAAQHKIPIIAGIWPFVSYKNAEFMANEVPGVVVPKNLLSRMSKAKTRQQGREIGIAIAREMIEAVSDKVAGFAISAPFGNVNIALATAGKIPIAEI